MICRQEGCFICGDFTPVNAEIIRKYIKGQHSALHCKTDIVGQCPEKFKCRTPKRLIIQLERAIAAQAVDVISEA